MKLGSKNRLSSISVGILNLGLLVLVGLVIVIYWFGLWVLDIVEDIEFCWVGNKYCWVGNEYCWVVLLYVLVLTPITCELLWLEVSGIVESIGCWGASDGFWIVSNLLGSW